MFTVNLINNNVEIPLLQISPHCSLRRMFLLAAAKVKSSLAAFVLPVYMPLLFKLSLSILISRVIVCCSLCRSKYSQLILRFGVPSKYRRHTRIIKKDLSGQICRHCTIISMFFCLRISEELFWPEE